MERWREAWCSMVNEAFERTGIEARIDYRSYEAQGVDQLPTIHEGPQIQEMESRRIKTSKADKNRWICSINRATARLKEDIAIIKKRLAERKAYREKLKEPGPVDYVSQYAMMRNLNAWSNKAKKQNLQKMMDTFSFIKAHNLRTMDDLEAFTDSISAQTDTILSKTRANTARIKKLDEMICFGKNILETQPVMDQMNAIHWKARRKKFRSAHEREINLYQMSKRILKQKHGVTEIRLSAW